MKDMNNLEYIKANGIFYRPQQPHIKDPNKTTGCYHVCIIKKLDYGKWQIDYYDHFATFENGGCYSFGDENKPNKKLILYPSGIEEIRYKR